MNWCSQFWWGVFLEIYFALHCYFRSKLWNVFMRFTLFAMQIKFQKFQRILIFLNFEARPTWWSKWSWFCENTLVCVMMATLDKWTPWLALGQVVVRGYALVTGERWSYLSCANLTLSYKQTQNLITHWLAVGYCPFS